MIGIRVALANGENFWLDCDLDQARAAFNNVGLVEIGGRVVNAAQVAQLVIEPVPSIESPARLTEEVA